MAFELGLPVRRALSIHEETVLGFSGAGGFGGGPWKLSPGVSSERGRHRSETKSVQKEGMWGRGEILQRDTQFVSSIQCGGETRSNGIRV